MDISVEVLHNGHALLSPILPLHLSHAVVVYNTAVFLRYGILRIASRTDCD